MRRNKIQVYLHFVWATWDRLPLITEEIERDLYRCIESICQECDCAVLAIGGMPDHLHLLITFPNTLTFSGLMKQVKGGSSRRMTEEIKPGEWFQWQANYGVFSVSPQDKSRVRRYIENQKQHHADGTLWPEAEETSEQIHIE
jgi:REP element-mobilizing transposase RayT